MVFSKKIKKKISFRTVLHVLTLLDKVKYFIQVGAHDGNMHDPLKEFVLKNKWHGILIEPQKKMIQQIKRNYQSINNLIYVNNAVYKQKEKIILYKVKNAKDYSHTGWASINSERFQNTIYEKNYLEEEVQGVPLMEIIKKNNFKKVDLLQIDTEGYDGDIIDMFDFKEFYPLLVQYEHIHLSKKKQIETKEKILKHGYYIIEKKNDTFALKKEQLTFLFIMIYVIIRCYQSFLSRLNNIIK